MIQIAIVDDSREMADMVQSFIDGQLYEKFKHLQVETKYYLKPQLLKYDLQEGHRYEIFILDVEMPELSGFELAKFIRGIQEDAYIIFLTSHGECAIEGFDLNIQAYQYILKDSMKEILPKVLERALKACEGQQDRMYLINNQVRFEKIRHQDIIRIYKEGKNIVIVAKDGTHRERKTLERIKKDLNNNTFLLIERGNVVNIEHIDRILKNEVYMDNGDMLEISRANIKAVKLKVNQYWRDNI